MSRPTVFVSYSHKDEEWKDRLVTHLGVLQSQGLLDLWDDRRISAGEDWHQEIQEAMAAASVAILLVSANFLTSQFILGEEVPRLLECRDKEGLRIFPVIVKPCAWQTIGWLSRMQARPKDGRPLSAGDEHQIDADLAAIATEVHDLLKRSAPPSALQEFVPLDPDKISTSRLPITGRDLFGRQAELGLLDQAWADTNTNVLSLVAWGGVGKSALVNHWLRGMAGDHYRGAERVYGWSFYSQGTTERAVSADLFIELALTWFGDPNPTQGSPWEKGERLARLVKAQRTLLLLDGLEPLQFPPGPQEGKLKDQALQALLRELAALNPGLCVISTRLPVTDLEHFQGSTARRINLEHLSPQAGAEILKAQGLKGDQAELEQAASDFGGHALALTLLGSFLSDAYDGDVRRRSEVGPLEEEMRHGGHARRVMASYEKWFGAGPELAVLRILGLFNRPADGPAVAVLRAAPAIPGLTDTLFHTEQQKGLRAVFSRRKPKPLSDQDWNRTVAKLRRARLLAEKDPAHPDALDAHPLVREHFGQQLRQNHPEAWRKGNNRLYEHLKGTAKELPDTIEEMAPLFAAVAHGCQAGRYQEALEEVYYRRIQRGQEFFSKNKLGALGAELAALSGFFDPPWRQLVYGLTEVRKSWVLNEAGVDLRALGRLAEAAQPMQASLEMAIAREGWVNAAQSAENLSELYLTSGDMAQALAYARQSVDLADRSSDAFMRMYNRTTLADGLHQAGHLMEAAAAFREAEEMQKARQPQFPLLYSLPGFQYCDLLLGQGKYWEVQSRAENALDIVLSGSRILLDIALNHLSLGRAYLLQAQQEGTGTSTPSAALGTGSLRASMFSQAAAHLERTVDGLRQAGVQDYLLRGLLARAGLRRVTGALDRARGDLEEVLSIATRGGMRLHEADCHLEYARLHLACGEQEKAREGLARAKEMVEEMGYHRRDGEVAELEGLSADQEAPA